MKSTLTFASGAGTVTGANFLLKTGEQNILVDCGLEQGGHFCSDVNYEPFPFDPHGVSVLVVTHAHMDHIGRIPKLIKDGFKGTIYSTPATKDLAEAMFEDALGILHDEARMCKKEPLYEKEHVEGALSQWDVYEYHENITLSEGVTLRFLDAGHILGSAMAEFSRNGKTFVFTGDLGNTPDVLLQPTESIKGATYLLMESVYGDRNHEGVTTRREVLKDAIEDTRDKGGVLLIPSFSLQRTQALLAEISDMIAKKEIQPIPLFLDSPLAIRVLDIYKRYSNLYNDEAKEKMRMHGDLFSFEGLTLTPRVEDSSGIEGVPAPKVIIAGSGMSYGGRIRSHEKKYLGDKSAMVLFVGYQVVGSLGRRIKDGAEKVQIDGEWIKIRAQIESLNGYSAHKDMDNLISFVEDGQESLKKVFVAMGEPKSSLFLTQRLRDFLSVDAIAPKNGESFEVDF